MSFTVCAGPRNPTNFTQTEKIGTAELYVRNNDFSTLNHLTLSLDFSEPRGTGNRDYQIQIKPDSFKSLAEGMILADREMAIKAFGAALQADATKRVEPGHGLRIANAA
jgi:hypothetical protein